MKLGDIHNLAVSDKIQVLELKPSTAQVGSADETLGGWIDLQPICEFLPDYEDPASPEDYAGQAEDDAPSRRRKPWRYRWPEDIHDEVLARLLALNAERAEEERHAGQAVEAEGKKTSRKRGRKKPENFDGQRLPGL